MLSDLYDLYVTKCLKTQSHTFYVSEWYLKKQTPLGYVHIDTSTSTGHKSGFRFTARTSFTCTSGAFMVTTPAHTPQRVSTDNLQ